MSSLLLTILLTLVSAQRSYALSPDGSASPASFTCALIMAQMQARYNDNTIELIYADEKRKTIEYTGERPTATGNLLEIRRIHLSGWSSSFSLNSYDPQGNPNWPIYLFGRKAAEALGIGPIGLTDNRMTIPSTKFLNNVLDQVSEKMPDGFKIRTRFYNSSEVKMKLTEYLKAFDEGAKLPMANVEDGVEGVVHDISFHVPSVILPEEVVAQSQKITHTILDFSSRLQAHFKGTRYEEVAKKMKTEMRFLWVRYLDEGTASVMASLASIASLSPAEQQNPETITKLFTTALPIILGRADVFVRNESHSRYNGDNAEGAFRTLTSFQALVRVLSDVVNKKPYIGRGNGGTLPDDLKAQYERFLFSPEFQKFEEQYIAQWKKDDPNYNINTLPSLKDLCLHMSIKRQKIINALESLVQ